MAASRLNPKTDALELFQKSTNDVRALKSKLSQADVGSIVQEVLSRVQKHGRANTQSPDHPSNAKIESLCYALISDDVQEGERFIQNVYDDGASLDAIYLAYLAEAAATLGTWWESDHVSFYEVSIGTSRIYGIMRGLSYLFVPDRLVEVKSAVFASVPGETHTLGIRMAADLLGKEGWDIDLLVGKSHDELVEQITESRCRIIGLSAAGTHAAPALARLVVALRISNPTAAIFLGGHVNHEAGDILPLMDLDGVISDVPSALALMDELWENSLRRAQ